MRGETQQLVTGELQGFIAMLGEHLAAHLGQEPELVALTWACAALLLAGCTLHFHRERRRG